MIYRFWFSGEESIDGKETYSICHTLIYSNSLTRNSPGQKLEMLRDIEILKTVKFGDTEEKLKKKKMKKDGD